ncbi:putative metal homeostasis protein [Paenibacillus polymyxa]|nr:putative metal homeostasis protein [Paenibacillus polymyxa]WDM21746.1 putative metal homeostasis protein [Paenibacillus polymyxa]
MAKTDLATARRQLSSPNKITRRRALRTIKAAKRAK